MSTGKRRLEIVNLTEEPVECSHSGRKYWTVKSSMDEALGGFMPPPTCYRVHIVTPWVFRTVLQWDGARMDMLCVGDTLLDPVSGRAVLRVREVSAPS